MGGSGGNFNSGTGPSPSDIRTQIQSAQKEEDSARYDQEVSALLASILKEYNDRDSDQIQQHLDTIRGALEGAVDGYVNLIFGGSISKYTYVNGLSDVDSLVLLNQADLAGKSPAEVKDIFYKTLKDRLPNTDIRIGNLAVTLKFRDHEIQLLPAIKSGSGFLISSGDGTTWSHIRPEAFAAKLKSVNDKCAGKVVPTIKLAKGIVGLFPDQKRVSGYHVESLAIAAFDGYTGKTSLREMLRHFFKASSERILTPINDSTGQSVHVDEYLGAAGSFTRKLVSDSLSRIARRIDNLDLSMNVESWKELLS
jgi:hypothetical protein